MDSSDSIVSLSPTETNKTTTTDDFIDATLNLSETHMEEGYKDGYKDGVTQGKQDAYQVGLRHGFECGQEVGFYRGLVDVWTAVEPGFFSSRVKKSVDQLNELIHEYPFMNPQDESKDVVIDKMRLKFKAICATLGVKLEFKGYPKVDHLQEY